MQVRIHRHKARQGEWSVCKALTLCGLSFLLGMTLWGDGYGFSRSAAGAASPASEIQILPLEADHRGGKAYRLIYLVSVDPDTYWRFKIDFENDLLTSNKYINSHRIVSHKDRRVVSESVYTYDPAHAFRWQTIIKPKLRQLDFQLLNAKECNQIFHYGSIQVQPSGDVTRVVQTAYFDFWGVGLWYHYPWSGGMREFLRYNASWEQRLAQVLKQRYPPPPQPGEGEDHLSSGPD